MMENLKDRLKTLFKGKDSWEDDRIEANEWVALTYPVTAEKPRQVPYPLLDARRKEQAPSPRQAQAIYEEGEEE